MNSFQIEAWALRIVDAVNKKQPNEDFRAELKKEWPTEFNKTAKQIAAHANAARGEPILWLIGVDEPNGIVGAEQNELANWWPKIRAEFDSVAPELTNLNVPLDNKTIVALYLETERAPFVVQNSPRDGNFTVPWREGNRTQTARRADLIRLLSPIQRLPLLNFFSGQLIARPNSSSNAIDTIAMDWDLTAHFYLTPADANPLTIPFHLCNVFVDLPHKPSGQAFQDVTIRPEEIIGSSDIRSQSRTLESTTTELLALGPGKAVLHSRGYSPSYNVKDVEQVTVRLDLTPAGGERAVSLTFTLPRKTKQTENHHGRWALNYPRVLNVNGSPKYIDD